jgi:hypothetical protein
MQANIKQAEAHFNTRELTAAMHALQCRDRHGTSAGAAGVGQGYWQHREAKVPTGFECLGYKRLAPDCLCVGNPAVVTPKGLRLVALRPRLSLGCALNQLEILESRF